MPQSALCSLLTALIRIDQNGTGPAKSRNPRNPPPISRNPHAKKRNPTPATKSTATPQKLIISFWGVAVDFDF